MPGMMMKRSMMKKGGKAKNKFKDNPEDRFGKHRRMEAKKGGKVLKPVPADKKKSLGKLPTSVRNKMGFMKKGGMVKKSKMEKCK